MKVLIVYPALNNEKGCPTLGQNRQFQYFKEPTYIYPIVPAQAATLLKQAGHEVVWLDCLAENIGHTGFINTLGREAFDLVALEAKTPVIKQIWKIIGQVKTKGAEKQPAVVLFGDHVTALPEESFKNSEVDFVLTGGDYDFLLLNLASCLSKIPITNCQLPVATLEPGIYYRDGAGAIKNTGNFQLNHDLNSLPFIDRQLTKWQLYAHENGNYKRTPGTYIMSGRDCWWGKCTFCSWPTLYPQFRLRKPQNVLEEIGQLIEKYHVREIMDDTGCFPVGEWLRDFCNGMAKSDLNKKIYLDCNMRFGALSADEFQLMKKANFRLLLFGLESANQKTLDRINKNLRAEDIIKDCRAATKAGLFPHITIMFGYPWEDEEDAKRTLELGCWLLKKGYASTMQATIVIPYPGSPLFEECCRNNWLKTLDWDDYDMKQPVMKSGIPDEAMMRFARGMYKASFNPEFLLRKIFSVRDADDLKYYLRTAKKVFGHIFDFSKK